MKELKQRDILYEVCKEIAMNDRTPEWIKTKIYKAVQKAKDVKEDEFPSLENNQSLSGELKVGSIVTSNVLDDLKYTFKIVAEKDIIDGVRLYDVVVVSGEGPHKIGSVVHNIPGTWLR